MTTLKFGKANSLVGFSTLKTSRFNSLPAARIVRELIQNSLDAAKEVNVTPAIVRFRVTEADHTEIPDFQGHSKALQQATTYHMKESGGKLPEPAEEAVNRIKAGLDTINSGRGLVLSVTDNGIGLDSKRMHSLLGDGASTKPDPLTGAYGVGHLAPLALSDIRYMLYGGVTKEGERTACGWTILASHPGKNQLNDAEGYLIKRFRNGLRGGLYDFLPEPEHPKLIANNLDQIAKEWGHGSAVIVTGFNGFRSAGNTLWEIVSKVSAYNFGPALYRGKLVVQVQDGQQTDELNAQTLEQILEGEQERIRAHRSDSFFRDLRPSGNSAFSILRTLQSDNSHTISVGTDSAHINFLTPLPEGQSRIDLFRNGMWISDDIPGLRRFDFTGLQPFHATIEINKEDGGELHRLVLKAEGPLHDNFSFVRLSKTEEFSLKGSIDIIVEWIKTQIPEISTEDYMVDDYLVVRTDNFGNKGKERFSFWGLPAPLARRQNSQLTDGPVVIEIDPPQHPPEPGPPGPPRPPRPPRPPGPRGEVRGRPLPFRSVVIPEQQNVLTASIECDRDLQEAWLTLRVDENSDVTCDRIWQDEDVAITSVSIKNSSQKDDDPKYEIMASGRTLKVKGLSAKETYIVQLKYDAPQDLIEMVSSPTFRLELHRPVRQTSHQQPGVESEVESADGNQC